MAGRAPRVRGGHPWPPTGPTPAWIAARAERHCVACEAPPAGAPTAARGRAAAGACDREGAVAARVPASEKLSASPSSAAAELQEMRESFGASPADLVAPRHTLIVEGAAHAGACVSNMHAERSACVQGFFEHALFPHHRHGNAPRAFRCSCPRWQTSQGTGARRPARLQAFRNCFSCYTCCRVFRRPCPSVFISTASFFWRHR